MKAFLAVVLAGLLSGAAMAQGKSGLDNPTVPIAPASTPQPATALDSTGIPGATDSTLPTSPVTPPRRGMAIKSGTVISMQLISAVNSGAVRNGDAVHGMLKASVKTTAGVMIPAGTEVDGTVVSAAKAGTVQSGGILSLQLTRVGAVPIVTDTVDFSGKEGHKDLADSAPQKGTEAVAQASVTFQFHVLENGLVPGVIPGAKLDKRGVGKGVGPASQPSVAQPDNRPGVNQIPVNGGSQPVQNAAPTTGPKS